MDMLDIEAPPKFTARVLPHRTDAEWAESLEALRGTPLDGKPLDPRGTLVCVVEEDGVVVAHVALLLATHAVDLWTAESHRGHAGTARLLVAIVTQELVQRQIAEVLAVAETPEVEALYAHAGGKQVPGTLWAIPVGGAR